MKILVFGDVHGRVSELSDMIRKIDMKPDIVVCPGDFTDMFDKMEGFSQIEIADMILQKLLSFRCPVLCIPGNHDPHEILNLFDKYKTSLHGKTKEVGGVLFVGWGGAPTPFNTFFEPSDEETKTSLSALSGKTKNKDFVLIVHDPPKNTKLDRTYSGSHVGSLVIRDFVLKEKPILCISAHIHEAKGIDKLGATTLFYPGPVFEGNYGVVTLEGKKVSCEIKTIK